VYEKFQACLCDCKETVITKYRLPNRNNVSTSVAKKLFPVRNNTKPFKQGAFINFEIPSLARE
jgi:hypothetical protein